MLVWEAATSCSGGCSLLGITLLLDRKEACSACSVGAGRHWEALGKEEEEETLIYSTIWRQEEYVTSWAHIRLPLLRLEVPSMYRCLCLGG